MDLINFDLVIIGGGITGAGIFNELSGTGLKICIIEKDDFGSGTSSKSSKLVHGGLRYLKEGNLILTYESVIHRERLINESPGLVDPVEFFMPLYENKSPGKFSLGAGLFIYDSMALKKRHEYLNKDDLLNKIPGLNSIGLKGGYSYMDAGTDDSVLVSKLINQGLKSKDSQAFNYSKIKKIINPENSDLKTIEIMDESGESFAVSTKVIINSCGAWGEDISKIPNKNLRIRPLKGSHLILKNDKFNLDSAVIFSHPDDQRPVFLLPWEGVLLLGTTDIDAKSMDDQKISQMEIDYLLKAAQSAFPEIHIDSLDIISSFSGIRPVISSGDKDPSKESREHFVWEDNGIISVTGGKLTTFRKLAWDTIDKTKKYFKNISFKSKKSPVFDFKTDSKTNPEKRIMGRYGLVNMEELRKKDLLNIIPGTSAYFAEIYIASQDETIKHLDDLLMRRTSLGMILENGGMDIIDKISAVSMENLGWSPEKWEFEVKRYKEIYNKFYSPLAS